MSSQNEHMQVSHEGNKLSTISASLFQSSLLSLHARQSCIWSSLVLISLRRHVQYFSVSLSGSGSISFFHHKLVKRVTLLLIGWVPSNLHSNWPDKQQLSRSLSLFLVCLSVSLFLCWLCSRVGWFGMTISQERNADNRSELPGVAASQLTRNKAFLTD